MPSLRRKNWLGNQRVDNPHLREIEAATSADFDLLAGQIIAGKLGVVVSGFEILASSTGGQADEIQLVVDGASVIHPLATESGSIFNVPVGTANDTLDSSNAKVVGSFLADATNYIGIDLYRTADASTSDVVQFYQPGTNSEVSEDVPLGCTLNYKIYISTNDFSLTPGLLPIAKVVTSTTNAVSSVTDCRYMLGRLAPGGSTPDAQGAYSWPGGRTETGDSSSFTEGDRKIDSLKAALDSLRSRIWEIGGGEYWYSATADRNVKMVRTGSPFASTGDWFEWDGTNLHWSGLSFVFDNSNGYVNEIANQTTSSTGLTDLLDGECIYVDIDRTQNLTGGNALVAQKATLSTLGTPTIPGSRFILAWRYGSNVYTRESTYYVGMVSPVATTSAVGTVKLAYTAGAPSAPVVLPLNANGQIVATFAANSTVPSVSVTGFISSTTDGGVGTSSVGGDTTHNSSAGGNGITGTGGKGNALAAPGGIGGEFFGGQATSSGVGGKGISARGGTSSTFTGGVGADIRGGTSTSGFGGIGATIAAGTRSASGNGSTGATIGASPANTNGTGGVGAIISGADGAGASGTGGSGATITAGNAPSGGDGGAGAAINGGTSDSGSGGDGADITGGASNSGTPGTGAVITAGTKTGSGNGGIGAQIFGSNGNTSGTGGDGVRVSGGNGAGSSAGGTGARITAGGNGGKGARILKATTDTSTATTFDATGLAVEKVSTGQLNIAPAVKFIAANGDELNHFTHLGLPTAQVSKFIEHWDYGAIGDVTTVPSPWTTGNTIGGDGTTSSSINNPSAGYGGSYVTLSCTSGSAGQVYYKYLATSRAIFPWPNAQSKGYLQAEAIVTTTSAGFPDANAEYWVGFTDNVTAPDAGTANTAMFRYKGGTDSTLMAGYTSNSGGGTATSLSTSAISGTGSPDQVLKIEFYGSGTERGGTRVVFSVNGVEELVKTTNMPTGAMKFVFLCKSKTGASVTRELRFGGTEVYWNPMGLATMKR